MRHTSIKLQSPCEFINIEPYNPLISKCQIKVCYVGETPNRNRSIITKEVAKEMANSLPGSPIVGFYDDETEDFVSHTKELILKDGVFSFKDKTRPYGFIDFNAKVWFQKFLDDGINEREYLMTEGWLWTGQYPECQRVITHGNNQSMELDEKNIDAYWTKDSNGKPQFFIINEAIFFKLCILGEDQEPCFEGANITVDFSFDEETTSVFKTILYQLQTFIEEGGNNTMPKNEDNLVTKTEQEELEFKKKEEEKNQNSEGNSGEENKEKTENNKEEQNTNSNNTKATTEEEDEKNKKKTEYAQEICPECGKPIDECVCKKEYSLEEIPEYVELKQNYTDLETKFSAQEQDLNNLKQQLSALTEFKTNVEKKEKEDMIKSFYMLSDEDKKDVIDHVDEYSLDDIEAKLSILCVRNKVNFNLGEEAEEKVENPTSYNLTGETIDDVIPAWAKAVITNQTNS